MSKNLPWLIPCILLFLLQIALASSIELAHDEAYYWLYSRNLDWGYFDHPPMVGLTIWLFSFLPKSELSLRMGFIIQQVISLALVLRLLPSTLRVRGALLFTAFPLVYFSGVLALPDMPVFFFSALYFIVLKHYLEEERPWTIAALTLVIPALLYSKYHGILLIFFTLLAQPSLFRRKSFYVITLGALLLFLPHVIWQYQHDFSTLRYHFIERPKSDFSLARMLEYTGVQIILAGLFAGPLVWWQVLRQRAHNPFERVMKFCAVGIVVFFFISTISKKFEANWSLPAGVPLIYLGAFSPYFDRRWGKLLLGASAGLILVVSLALTFASDILPIKRLKEFHGWNEWAQEVFVRCEGKNLMANSYQIASKLSYYLDQSVPALNYRSRKNQFDYWQFEKLFPGQEVCYVTDKSEFEGEKILTPEGKALRLVTDLTMGKLLELKAEQSRQQ